MNKRQRKKMRAKLSKDLACVFNGCMTGTATWIGARDRVPVNLFSFPLPSYSEQLRAIGQFSSNIVRAMCANPIFGYAEWTYLPHQDVE